MSTLLRERSRQQIHGDETEAASFSCVCKDAKTKIDRSPFFCALFSLHSSFTISSPPPYRWSQAAFNNPMHSHASTPEATPLMLHYSHTHIQGGSASSLGRTPVSQAQIGSVWFSMEQQHWALGLYMGLQGPTLALTCWGFSGKKLLGSIFVVF